MKVTIVRHWKNWNSQQWRKILFSNRFFPYLVTIVFGAFIGILLDLYFVNKGYYEFPIRPFRDLFSINLAFTLFVLPIVTLLFLIIMKKVNRLERFIVIFIICFLVPIGEHVSEHLGFLRHHESWKHSYSFIGYFFYLIFVWKLFQWMDGKK